MPRCLAFRVAGEFRGTRRVAISRQVIWPSPVSWLAADEQYRADPNGDAQDKQSEADQAKYVAFYVRSPDEWKPSRQAEFKHQEHTYDIAAQREPRDPVDFHDDAPYDMMTKGPVLQAGM